MDLVALTPESLRLVQELVRREMRQVQNTRGRPWYPPGDEIRAPQVRIALTPPGGIPALVMEFGTGTGSGAGIKHVPGKASCNTYKIAEIAGVEELLDTGESLDVYNLSQQAVASGQFVPVARLRDGRWALTACVICFTPSTGTGTGSGSGSVPTSCCGNVAVTLYLTITDVELDPNVSCSCLTGAQDTAIAELVWNPTDGAWEGSIILCGISVIWQFNPCLPGLGSDFTLDSNDGSLTTPVGDAPASCSPFMWTARIEDDNSLCAENPDFPTTVTDSFNVLIRDKTWWCIEAALPFCFFGTEAEAGADAATHGATFTGPYPTVTGCNAACGSTGSGSGSGTGGGGSVHRFDTFNRADENPMVFPSDGGSAWVMQVGSQIAVSGNAAVAGLAGVNYATLNCTNAFGTVNVTIVTQDATNNGLLLQWVDSSNFFSVVSNAAGTHYAFRKTLAGVLVTDTDFGPAPVDGDVLKVVIGGTGPRTYDCYVNNVLAGSFSDAGFASGLMGIVISGAGKMDDFNVASASGGGTGGTLLRYDDFNRANVMPPGVPSDGGSAWVTESGGYLGLAQQAEVSGDQLTNGGAAGSGSTLGTGTAEMDVRATLVTTNAPANVGLLARFADADNFILMYANSTPQWTLSVVVGGIEVLNVAFGSAPANGDVVQLVCVGLTVKCYINGALLHTSVLASGPSGTKAGVYFSTTGMFIDDFSVRTV